MTPEEIAAAAAAAEKELGWRAGLPTDLQKDASLVDFKDETEMIPMPINVAKSFIHTKKLVGADTYKMPNTDDEWSAHHTRMGRPETANLYVLPVPEAANPKLKEVLGKDAEWFKEEAHKLGLSDKQATGIFQKFSSRVVEQMGTIEGTAATDALNVEAAMRTEFGPGYDGQMVLAKRAMSELGGPEFADMLNNSGISKTAIGQRVMIKIGGMMAEELGLDKTTGDLIMSKQSITDEIQSLMAKPEYLDKTKPDHAALVQRVAVLMQKAHGTEKIPESVASIAAP